MANGLPQDPLSRRALALVARWGDPKDRIPSVRRHRGVPIHDGQPASRVASVVRPAIDYVHNLADVAALAAYCRDCSYPPEARLLAGAKLEAAWQLSSEDRSTRPVIDLDKIRAATAEVGSARWRDPDAYRSLLDNGHPVRRVPPLLDTIPARVKETK